MQCGGGIGQQKVLEIDGGVEVCAGAGASGRALPALGAGPHTTHPRRRARGAPRASGGPPPICGAPTRG
jgi:hypothetical protein